MNDNYLAEPYIEVTNELIVCNPIVLYEYFKVNDSYELALKVHNYVNENKETFNKKQKKNNYSYSYCVNELCCLDFTKLTFIEDINLLIDIFCKTFGGLYIPNRKLEISSTSFEKILLFNKKDFYEG